MRIDWAVLAEAAAQDGRGAFTALGIGQNLHVASRLPAQIKRAILVHVTGEPEEFKPGRKITIGVSCTAPSGKVLIAASRSGTISSSEWPGLPPAAILSADAGINTSEYGPHTVSIEVQLDDESAVTTELNLYVMPPSKGIDIQGEVKSARPPRR